MKVSVYIITYNRFELFVRAYDSVLSQDYPDIEIIVVNDGDCIKTKEFMLDELSRLGSERLKYLESGGKGACAARNLGIFSAAGELITGLDDDDYFYNSRISTLTKVFFDKNRAYSFVSDSSDGRIGGVVELEDFTFKNPVGNQLLTKTEYLRSLGGFDTNLPAWQDYDMWFRLVERYGSGFKISTKLQYVDTNHGGERISVKIDKVLLAQDIFIEKHRSHYSQSDMEIRKMYTAMRYGVDYIPEFKIRYLFGVDFLIALLKFYTKGLR